MSLREKLLAAAQSSRRVKAVELQGCGVTVYVRELSGADRDAMELHIEEMRKAGTHLQNKRAIMAIAFLCDESGAQVASYEDAAELGKLPARDLDAIFEAGDELNQVSVAATEAAEKN